MTNVRSYRGRALSVMLSVFMTYSQNRWKRLRWSIKPRNPLRCQWTHLCTYSRNLVTPKDIERALIENARKFL